MLLWTHTPQHKQTQPYIIYIIEQCVGILSSSARNWIRTWTCEFYGQNSTNSWRTTRYDNGLSPKNKASKIQKLAFRCFLLTSVKAKKFQDGDQSVKLYTTIFSATEMFFKNPYISFAEDDEAFPSLHSNCLQNQAISEIKLDRQTDRHTGTQTDYCKPST